MNLKKLSFTLFILGMSFVSAQEKSESKKGSFYTFWGWNRSGYSSSDIQFKGKGYDFTLQNVKADDKQVPVNLDNVVKKYLHPGNITLPQTNFKIGYFINDTYDVSIGLDHMKYVMRQNQMASIDGQINIPGSVFNNTYQGEEILLHEDFLTFEHTDGLNYVHLGFTRNDDWGHLLNFNTDKVQVSSLIGPEMGILLPKTNTQLLGKKRYDAFHVSGYGLSAKVGINILFWKHFFIQGELKGGFINMPNIRTTESKDDSASQSFFYHQQNFSLGYRFKL